MKYNKEAIVAKHIATKYNNKVTGLIDRLLETPPVGKEVVDHVNNDINGDTAESV